MKTLFYKLVFVGFIALLLAPRLSAQTESSQFFLKIDGIDGESKDTNHQDWIDVVSFKLGVSQHGVTDFGGGAGAGKSTFLPLGIFKNVDKATPALFLACATGKHIPTVKLVASRPSNNGDYLTITLTDVLVSSLNSQSAEDSGGVDSVLESLSLNFAQIQVSYKPENPDHVLGSAVTGGFNVKLNKKL